MPDFDPTPASAGLPKNSAVKPLRFSLKVLAAYAVAIVNGAALVYIMLKIFAGLRSWLETN